MVNSKPFSTPMEIDKKFNKVGCPTNPMYNNKIAPFPYFHEIHIWFLANVQN